MMYITDTVLGADSVRCGMLERGLGCACRTCSENVHGVGSVCVYVCVCACRCRELCGGVCGVDG